jgi:tRNA-dihydrouridine synthase
MPPVLQLAPIRGITDFIYREAFAQCFGCFDRAVAPFLQVRQGVPLRVAELRQLSPGLNRGIPTIPQLLTNHGPSFLSALRELAAAGHGEANWNLGCPSPSVGGRGRGAGLLPHPDRIDAILEEVCAHAPVRLSVKLRLGDENPDAFIEVIRILNRYPLAEVILHARTAIQGYEGKVDLERAAQALSLCRHPFCHSGDLVDAVSFRATQAKLPGAASWMIGRGALIDPFLPSQIKGAASPDAETRRRKLREFHGRLVEGYGRSLSGPRHLLDRMAGHWVYLAQAFADSKAVLLRIHRSGVLDSYHRAVNWAFEQKMASRGA